MKIPYNEWELMIALISLDEKKFTKEKMKELGAELAVLIPKSKKDLNKKIAECHGITVKELINSSNYKVLCEEYQENVIREFMKKVVEKLEITPKQAWAMVAVALGLLDI